MPLDNGAVFAGFRIVRPLGSGGMGEVYLAQHPRLPRREALKILSSTVSADTVFRERFNREADIVASLSHPHIVGVHDRGEFDGQLWISMEYIDGTDAARLIRNRYPAGMPAAEAVEIITAVAGALDYAHQQGLLHRDIKPANMLLTRPDDEGQRQVFLADFGIARELADPSGLTATNIAVGTVAYAAPEQLMGQQLDGRADQYGLAATAFHMLTGAPPPVVVGQHLNAPIPKLSDFRPNLAGLDQAMSTALAKNPYQRFSSCRDFAKALREHVPSAPFGEHTTQAAPTRADVRRPRRISVPTVVSGVIAAALVVLTTVALRFADPDTKPPSEPTNTASPSATALPVATLPTNQPPAQLPAAPYTPPQLPPPPPYTPPQLPAPPRYTPPPDSGDLNVGIPMSHPRVTAQESWYLEMPSLLATTEQTCSACWPPIRELPTCAPTNPAHRFGRRRRKETRSTRYTAWQVAPRTNCVMPWELRAAVLTGNGSTTRPTPPMCPVRHMRWSRLTTLSS